MNKGKIKVTYEVPVELLDKVPLPEGSTIEQALALSTSIGVMKAMGEGREILLSGDDSASVKELLRYILPTLCVQAANKLLNEYEEEAREAKAAILSYARDIRQRLTRQNNEGDN
jgi:hypothetical protein